MKNSKRWASGIALSATLLGGLGHASAAINILGNRFDNNRTAANLTETTLTPTTVGANTFGKIGSYAVDGAIFAQPLYVQGVLATGQTVAKNVLFVATMHDVVYAFDADKPGSAPLWTHDFRSAGITPGTPFDTATASDGMGIIGTPTIDLASNRMYLVAETMEAGAYVQRIHALDIRSGADLAATVIKGSANGQTFDPHYQSQRPGLAVSAGQVWVAFGSTIPGDFTPWHGWVMTYDMTTLAQTGVLVTATGSGGGIWQSGGAPAVDAAGNVYYLTGNGTGQAYDGVNNFQESLLKLTYSGGLKLSDWYTAADWAVLDQYDLDLTCTGPMLVPGTDLITFGGKVGTARVLHTGSSLGHLTTNDAQVAQMLQIGPLPPYAGNDGDRTIGFAYWQRGAGNSLMFAWPGFSSLTSYIFNGTTFAQSQQNTLNLFGEPSAALSISANGTTVGSGILWVARNTAAGRTVGQAAVLEAYNADNIGQLLWSSTQNLARDDIGSSGRFVVPVVNNGRVYMATSSGSVAVYGPISTSLSVTLTSPAAGASVAAGSPVTLTASALDKNTGATIRGVSFYDGTTLLATVAAAPYTFVWTSPGIGTHTLSAVVTDSLNLSATSGAVTLTVTGSTSWTEIGVSTTRVARGADGTTIVVNKPAGTLWKYNGSPQNWSNLPAPIAMKDVAVVNANSIYAIGTDGNVYRYNGSAWHQVGRTASAIGAASDGTVVVVSTNPNQTIWRKVADNDVEAWTQISGTAKRVAPASANNLWKVGIDGNPYFSVSNGPWTLAGNTVADIAASPDGHVAVFNATTGVIWTGVAIGATPAWQSAGFNATALSIVNGGGMTVVGTDSNVYQK